MDPKMMEMAMEQMRRMSPDQMQALMGSMGQMNPAMMQMAMQQMQNMSPADLQRMSQQVNSMDPTEMASQAQEATKMLSGRQQYIINASQMLKADGNRLHTAGKYQEAAEKYERARANLAELRSLAEAADLHKSCTLNLGSCYLNLGHFQDAIAVCDEVLAGDGQNLKALYRRGQAHAALQQNAQAVTDLQKALQLSSRDPQQQQFIKERLEAATQALTNQQQQQQHEQQESASQNQEPASAPAEVASSSAVTDEDGLIEEVTDDTDDNPGRAKTQHLQQDVAPESPSTPQAAMASSSGNHNHSSTSAGLSNSSLPSPEQLQMMAEMMRNNPGMMQQAAKMMQHLTPAQMATLSQQAGHPDITSITQAQQNLADLTPEQLEMMAKISSMGPAAMDSPEALTQAAQIFQREPGMLKTAAQMMQAMPEEQLQAAMAQAGMPAGMKLTPEMIAMASEQLSRMQPAELQQMVQAASKAGMPGGIHATPPATTTSAPDVASSSRVPTVDASAGTVLPGAAVGAPDMSAMMTPEMLQMASSMMAGMKPEDLSAMSSMMGPTGSAGAPGLDVSPQMMEAMVNMMQSMDEATLAQMLKGMVAGGDDARATQMAKQLKQLSPAQMRMMAKGAALAQAAAQTARQARSWLASRQVLVLTLMVLLVAVLLRYFHII